ncbi:hypothetical protein CYQ88_10860 [Hydrogenovibrio sp. SC-1]|uniref:hypothetical protein n=1 Tax=Hydrogenovibrio sp. SC-1 TaxID=2065820 RepID=UPI000C7A162B|nr:hypothetical protein [Hydrogenovibrio sp. SC-1]PLA73515.1 hypothetical protein CYQ88_10860 [Hydrogenovibrio sp. SC-1]
MTMKTDEINKTIGRIKCPILGDMAELRRNKKGKLYYLGKAGMITPNKTDGQEYLLDHGQFFNKDEMESFNDSDTSYGQRVPQESEGGDSWMPL